VLHFVLVLHFCAHLVFHGVSLLCGLGLVFPYIRFGAFDFLFLAGCYSHIRIVFSARGAVLVRR
jgi:hypothetical protein